MAAAARSRRRWRACSTARADCRRDRRHRARARAHAGRTARRALTQPPFDASAMDGYAVRAADIAKLPATLAVIGAGRGRPSVRRQRRRRARRCASSPARRVPEGADAIVIQEDTERDGDKVIVRDGSLDRGHIRRRGFDFREGETLLSAGRRLGPARGRARRRHGPRHARRPPPPARRHPVDGRRAGGAGRTAGPGQIVSSNHLGVAALAEVGRRRGAAARHRARHAREPRRSLRRGRRTPTSSSPSAAPRSATTTWSARCWRRAAWRSRFWKIAMRPGKPLMFGRLGAPACWACRATRSRRWCARACSSCR